MCWTVKKKKLSTAATGLSILGFLFLMRLVMENYFKEQQFRSTRVFEGTCSSGSCLNNPPSPKVLLNGETIMMMFDPCIRSQQVVVFNCLVYMHCDERSEYLKGATSGTLVPRRLSRGYQFQDESTLPKLGTFTRAQLHLEGKSPMGDRTPIHPSIEHIPRQRQDEMVISTGELVKFDRCKFFLNEASCLESWPEDIALKEPPLMDVRDAADPSKSTMRPLFNRHTVGFGDTLEVEVVLYDGFGRQITRGGNQILVWMRDTKRGASVTGHVEDNQDGSFRARLPVWWEGDLEIVSVVTAPRQLVEAAFRWRYQYPPLVYDEIKFRHADISEITSCNTVPHIPGYDTICNLTSENYGNAWFCGKPRNSNLTCSDWSFVTCKWSNHTSGLTRAEINILEKFHGAQFLPDRILVKIKTGKQAASLQPSKKCHEITTAETWGRAAPIGYFYGNHWINSLCQVPNKLSYINHCLKNTNLLMVGDSTLRQWHDAIRRAVDCPWKGKQKPFHQEQTCFSPALNSTITWNPHGLPWNTVNSPRTVFKPFSAHLAEIPDRSRYIIVLHAYAHYTPSHSSMFTQVIRSLVPAIEKLLARNPNVIIAIKGPHSYAVGLNGRRILMHIDKYADIYQAIIQREFSQLTNKVIFIDFLDMTRAAESKGVHATDGVISEVVNQFFGQICKPN